MNTAPYRYARKELPIDSTASWVYTALLILMMTWGLTSESQASISTAILDKLLAGDGAAWDEFGYSVSIAGDTAVIGARVDDDNGENSGSAYVFVRDGSNNWSQQAKLTADDGAANDRFGISVSIAGDTTVIGAYADDDNGSFSGSAYVFVRDGSNNWSQKAKLTADDGATSDWFGYSVSIAGDTVVIGAALDDDNGNIWHFCFNRRGHRGHRGLSK